MQGEVVPQSYAVDSDGDTIRRNRRALVRLPDTETAATPSEPGEQINEEPGEQAQTNIMTDSNNTNDSLDPTNQPNTQPNVRRSTQHSRPPDRLDPSRSW